MAAYLNALHNPFVYDDLSEVVNNRSIEHLTNVRALALFSITRPVVNFSYALDYALGAGRSPFGYHVTNLVLHVLNVTLLFAFVIRAVTRSAPNSDSRATLTAFGATSLFAVHPMMTEAVGYVSSRSELLCGSFVLGSLLCFERVLAGKETRWLVGGFAFFALAMGTRETAVMLPVVLLAYDVIILRNRPGRRRRLATVHAPLMVLVAAAALARVWLYIAVEHAEAAPFPWRNAFVVLDVLGRYLTGLLIPISQSVVPPVSPIASLADPRALVAAAILTLAVTVAILGRARRPLVSFGIAWFFLFLVPSSSLILLSDKGQPMAEHRVYLASCGVFMALGEVLAQAIAPVSSVSRLRRLLSAGALTGIIATLLTLTVLRNRVWSDPILLWSDAVAKAPGTFQAHYGLADAYRAEGDHASAETTFQLAIALRPQLVTGYLGLAGNYLDEGKTQKAAEVLRLGILRVPADPQARLSLAAIEEENFHDTAEALRLCREAAAIAPRLAAAQECIRRNQQTASGGAR
jgi:hypothetical protein